jgi:hypothetical protein
LAREIKRTTRFVTTSGRKPPLKFPVPKPTGRARPKSQGANQGMTSKKPTQRQVFKTGEFIVYPAHGVGQIVAIEEQEVPGFVKDKMTLRVPTAKISAVGMRKLIVTPATPATVAVQRETRTIPIVFVALGDPVASGIVARLDRPSGNVTGFALFEATLGGKWLELLSEIAPGLKRAAFMFNPNFPPASTYVPHLRWRPGHSRST